MSNPQKIFSKFLNHKKPNGEFDYYKNQRDFLILLIFIPYIIELIVYLFPLENMLLIIVFLIYIYTMSKG